jgi:hypothetical protein
MTAERSKTWGKRKAQSKAAPAPDIEKGTRKVKTDEDTEKQKLKVILNSLSP